LLQLSLEDAEAYLQCIAIPGAVSADTAVQVIEHVPVVQSAIEAARESLNRGAVLSQSRRRVAARVVFSAPPGIIRRVYCDAITTCRRQRAKGLAALGKLMLQACSAEGRSFWGADSHLLRCAGGDTAQASTLGGFPDAWSRVMALHDVVAASRRAHEEVRVARVPCRRTMACRLGSPFAGVRRLQEFGLVEDENVLSASAQVVQFLRRERELVMRESGSGVRAYDSDVEMRVVELGTAGFFLPLDEEDGAAPAGTPVLPLLRNVFSGNTLSLHDAFSLAALRTPLQTVHKRSPVLLDCTDYAAGISTCVSAAPDCWACAHGLYVCAGASHAEAQFASSSVVAMSASPEDPDGRPDVLSVVATVGTDGVVTVWEAPIAGCLAKVTTSSRCIRVDAVSHVAHARACCAGV
jgi:hypothetical protein